MDNSQKKTKEIRFTVASLRLDSVTGAGFGVSRNKISNLIKGDNVVLNQQVVNNTSKHVKQGDEIVVLGRGKIIVEKIGGITKKGRVSVIIKKLLNEVLL